MKLKHHLLCTILASSFVATAVPAATLPNFKGAPVATKVPAAPKIQVVKVPVVKAPTAAKLPKAPKIPVVKTPAVPKVRVAKVPAAPKIPVVKAPVVSKIVSAPKTPVVKIPVSRKIPATPKVVIAKVPAIAKQIRTPQPPKVPQAAPKMLVSPKTPAIPRTRTLSSNKQTGKTTTAPAITPVTRAVNVTDLGRELVASGIIAEKKEFVASRIGQFSDVNAARPVVPDTDSDAQEMAVIPATSAPSDGTDPASAAGEMWTPWWANGSTEPNTGRTGGTLEIRDQAGSTPREPAAKSLLYAPNPVKSGTGNSDTQKKK